MCNIFTSRKKRLYNKQTTSKSYNKYLRGRWFNSLGLGSAECSRRSAWIGAIYIWDVDCGFSTIVRGSSMRVAYTGDSRARELVDCADRAVEEPVPLILYWSLLQTQWIKDTNMHFQDFLILIVTHTNSQRMLSNKWCNQIKGNSLKSWKIFKVQK